LGLFRRQVVPKEVVQQILDMSEGLENDSDVPAIVPYTPSAAASLGEMYTSLIGATLYFKDKNVKLAICKNLHIIFVDNKTLREVTRKKGRDKVGNWTSLWNMMIAEGYKVMKVIINGTQLIVKEEYENGIRRS